MRRLVGAYFFEHEWRAWPADEARAVASNLREIGVDSIVSESDTLRDDVIDAIRGEGLLWWAAVSLFSDHANANAVLDERPHLRPVLETGVVREQMEWYVGTIPTDERYTAERLSTVERLVRAHEIDGLVLDFARWPLHWEIECRSEAEPPLASYDAISLERFRAASGVAVPTYPAQQVAAWIAANAWTEWVAFRSTVITQTVAEAATRVRSVSNIPLGVFTVPLPPDELENLVGQRLSGLGEIVDYVFPMTYHAMLGRRPNWIRDIVAAHRSEAGKPALPVVQVDTRLGKQFGADWGDPVSEAEWSDVVLEALESSEGDGLIAFPGTDLLRRDRARALRLALDARGTGART